MRISDWSSDVCSSDLAGAADQRVGDGDRRTGDNIGRDAAILVDLVIVADQADRQRIARFEQQLPAHAPTVAVVDVLPQVKVAGIAVAPVVIADDRKGDSVTDRAGDDALDAYRGQIAVAHPERDDDDDP